MWKLLFMYVGMDNILFQNRLLYLLEMLFFCFMRSGNVISRGIFSKSDDISGSYVFFQEIHKLTTKFVSVIIFLDMCKTLAQFFTDFCGQK